MLSGRVRYKFVIGGHHKQRLPPKPAWLNKYNRAQLDADDWDLIEQIKNTGRIDVTCVWSWITTGYCFNYGGSSMRAAELRSREADRENSAWFNDDMLDYWEDKWYDDDWAAAGRDETARITKIERAELAAIRRIEREHQQKLSARRREEREEKRAQERVAWTEEMQAWRRDLGYAEEQARKRKQRWSAEEREWYEWEQERKADKLRTAMMDHEARQSLRRRQFRAVQSAKRSIRELERHVNRRNPRHSRHQRKDDRALEAA
jgi:hypothetical protein